MHTYIDNSFVSYKSGSIIIIACCTRLDPCDAVARVTKIISTHACHIDNILIKLVYTNAVLVCTYVAMYTLGVYSNNNNSQ